MDYYKKWRPEYMQYDVEEQGAKSKHGKNDAQEWGEKVHQNLRRQNPPETKDENVVPGVSLLSLHIEFPDLPRLGGYQG